jgi:hypothetical protein
MKAQGAVSCTRGDGAVRNAQSLATRALKGHIGARDRGLRPSPEKNRCLEARQDGIYNAA